MASGFGKFFPSREFWRERKRYDARSGLYRECGKTSQEHSSSFSRMHKDVCDRALSMEDHTLFVGNFGHFCWNASLKRSSCSQMAASIVLFFVSSS